MNCSRNWPLWTVSIQQWVLGYAATRDTVQIGYFQPNKEPGSVRLTVLARLAMRENKDRVQFVSIFLNFAKYLSEIKPCLIRRCPLTEVPVERGNKQVSLNGCFVTKVYVMAEPPEHLDDFYEATKFLPGIEKRVKRVVSNKQKLGFSARQFIYTLSPVGLEVLNNERPKALTRMIEIVKKLHSLKWAHLDIRWQNVIFDPVTQDFFLIDSEFATPFDQPLPFDNLKTLQDLPFQPSGCCPEIDWYSIVRMINRTTDISDDLRQHAEAFLSFNIKVIRSALKE
jgi:hypothetical protein